MEKHGGRSKRVPSRHGGSSVLQGRPHSNSRNQKKWRADTRRKKGLYRDTRKYTRTPARDVKRESFSEGSSCSFNKAKLDFNTCKTVILSEYEYRDHFTSNTHRLEVVRTEKTALRHRGRSPPLSLCQPQRCSRSPTFESRWHREVDPSTRAFIDPSWLDSHHQQPCVGPAGASGPAAHYHGSSVSVVWKLRRSSICSPQLSPLGPRCHRARSAQCR